MELTEKLLGMRLLATAAHRVGDLRGVGVPYKSAVCLAVNTMSPFK